MIPTIFVVNRDGKWVSSWRSAHIPGKGDLIRWRGRVYRVGDVTYAYSDGLSVAITVRLTGEEMPLMKRIIKWIDETIFRLCGNRKDPAKE